MHLKEKHFFPISVMTEVEIEKKLRKRALLRIANHPVVLKDVEEFRQQFPEWSTDLNRLGSLENADCLKLNFTQRRFLLIDVEITSLYKILCSRMLQVLGQKSKKKKEQTKKAKRRLERQKRREARKGLKKNGDETKSSGSESDSENNSDDSDEENKSEDSDAENGSDKSSSEDEEQVDPAPVKQKKKVWAKSKVRKYICKEQIFYRVCTFNWKTLWVLITEGV